MKFTTLSCGLLFATLLLTSCQQEQAQSAGEATPPPAATPTEDSNAINQPIADGAVAFQLALTSAPRITPAGTLELSVSITNTGTVPVYGVGTMPVNLGVQILGAEGTLESAGGQRDFLRIPLPLIQPGANGTVNVEIPADSIASGLELRIALVQEKVRWYDSEQNSTLNIGKFDVCGSKFCAPATN